MGCCAYQEPKVVNVVLDVSWTPSELGHYILSLDLESTNLDGLKWISDTPPRSNVDGTLVRALMKYLVYKNKKINPGLRDHVITDEITTFEKSNGGAIDIFGRVSKGGTIVKWMLENGIFESSQDTTEAKDCETIGMWCIKYSEEVSPL
eukprot:7778_1